MLANYEHIAFLITGFNNGTITEKEQDELDAWITTNDQNQLLFEELSDPNLLRDYLKQMESYNEGGIWENIKRKFPLIITPVRKLFPWKKVAVAASIFLMVGIGSYFAFFNKNKNEEIAKLPETKDVEAPKGTKAMITLADGRMISIDSLTSIDQSSVTLTRTPDGKIIYTGSSTEVVYNTLSNPKGSKVIDMTLADGSHVWLNAGSSVTYPVAFVGNNRNVSITGEAYFEVSSNKTKPFIVSKGEVQIKVLGTQFNVNAYEDEMDMKVTLLEGSVEVNKGNANQILRPGEQAQISSDIKIKKGINIEEVMAWKNGYFKYTSATLPTLMRQASRWYDVEVVYAGKVPGDTYTGAMPRTVTLAKWLKVLEESGVKFRIDGKKLTVMSQ